LTVQVDVEELKWFNDVVRLGKDDGCGPMIMEKEKEKNS